MIDAGNGRARSPWLGHRWQRSYTRRFVRECQHVGPRRLRLGQRQQRRHIRRVWPVHQPGRARSLRLGQLRLRGHERREGREQQSGRTRRPRLCECHQRHELRGADVPEPHYLTWFISFMPLLWLLLAVAIVGLLFGYLALSYFIAGKILDTVLVVVMMVLTHHLIDALADTLQNPASVLGEKLRNMTSIGDRGIARLSLSFRTIADILVVVLGIPWLLALWTVTWVDFRSFITTTLVGFKVGNVTVSPFNIASLIGILILGVILTRFITRWLDRRILTQTRLNKGVQDSVRTGANYMGYVFAAGFALSAAGFDFSNIAIIAGALGVGIGFGLQSIVNNFVSGLILLAERPIRVGDWVVTGDGEGIVKKINVRSTEIETFDNCTIIVPNSNLITSSVRNWTHHDTLGRFLVTVGVAPGTDPEIAAGILTQVVNAHSKVLRFPAATIQLARFTNYSIEFELRGHVADIFEAAQVSSDLRFALSKAFKEKGIIIPSISEPPVRT